jgi:hypothetical protein
MERSHELVKRNVLLVLAGACFALSCSGSDASGSPGTNTDASAGSGGQSASTGGASAGGAASGGSSASGGAGGVTAGAGGMTSGGAGAGGSATGGAAGSNGTGGSATGGSGSCGGTQCRVPAELCVAHRTVGGGMLLPDAGRCPAGTHVEGTSRQYCAADYAYECVDLVGCNPGSISCSCGGAICPSRYPACSDPTPNRVGLDPVAQLVCELLAP